MDRNVCRFCGNCRERRISGTCSKIPSCGGDRKAPRSCFFNFRKRAKCFAGDVGSVSIAFILLFLIGRLIIGTGDFSWIVLLSVYGVDSVLTIIHRLMLHENIGLPHRKHLYQIMANELKIPHIMVSSIYMAVQAIIIVGYIMCLGYSYWYLAGIILLLCFLYICFMKKYFGLHQST